MGPVTRPTVAAPRVLPLGVLEVAALLGVKKNTVHQWRARNKMPPPDGHIGGAPVWWEETIRGWCDGTL